MKLEHSWQTRPDIEVDTFGLVSGYTDYAELLLHPYRPGDSVAVKDRIERLATIVARLIDHIGLTDDEKRAMFRDILGDWKFVEDKNDRP
jgi:hypothetical protein